MATATLIEVKEATAQAVGHRLSQNFKRIKGIWDDVNRSIRGKEKKSEKINEELFELKENRENLEHELESIRQAYEQFCDETGVNFDLG